jgi:hypothetical protein
MAQMPCDNGGRSMAGWCGALSCTCSATVHRPLLNSPSWRAVWGRPAPDPARARAHHVGRDAGGAHLVQHAQRGGQVARPAAALDERREGPGVQRHARAPRILQRRARRAVPAGLHVRVHERVVGHHRWRRLGPRPPSRVGRRAPRRPRGRRAGDTPSGIPPLSPTAAHARVTHAKSERATLPYPTLQPQAVLLVQPAQQPRAVGPRPEQGARA